MRVTKVTFENPYYTVHLKYNWLEKLFGFRDKTIRLKSSGDFYVFGRGWIYVAENGELTDNGSVIGEAIDKFRRKNSF